jgi:glycosyltransferase involved in cell wall biosynthesis
MPTVLRRHHYCASVPELRASIVVPTHGRPAQLRSCLETLAAQEPAGAFEIVVVDDGSPEPDAIEAAAAGVPATTVVRFGGRGPAAARNAGVAAARGPIVCFTDDDCEPVPGWLAALLHPIEAGAIASAGPTVVPPTSDGFARATQLIVDRLIAGSPSGFVPTSNLACTRGVLGEVPFDERFPLYAEDRDWCARLRAAGHSHVWVAEAVVVHRLELDLMGFLRKHERYGRGAFRFRRANASFRRLEPPSFYAGLVRDAARSDGGLAALVCAAQLATAVGFVHEALRPSGRRDTAS